MKTASNKLSPLSRAILFAVALGAWGGATPSLAADQALPASVPSAALPAMPASAPAPAVVDAALPLPAGPAAATTGAPEVKKAATAGEEKITDGARALIKKLDSIGDSTSLDDLNKARQTVARIDAMIEIEKRLAELEKVRNERSGKSAATLASAIPASALTPPINQVIAPMPAMASEPRPQMMIQPSFGEYEVTRIVGSNGRYIATILAGGKSRTFSVGDKIGSSTVQSISADSVTIGGSGEQKTLRMKDVGFIRRTLR